MWEVSGSPDLLTNNWIAWARVLQTQNHNKNWIAWARVLQIQNHKVIELHELVLSNQKTKNSELGNNWIVWDIVSKDWF